MAKKTKKTASGQLHIRVTPEQKALIESAAQSRGLMVSAWLRMVALAAVKNGE